MNVAPRYLSGLSVLFVAAGLALAIPGMAASAQGQPVPPRPTPPYNAAPSLIVPPLEADGVRASVDRKITPALMVWNLRAAWNVAALDCPQPQYVELSDGYRTFLKAHARALAAANSKTAAEFRQHYHGKGSSIHDSYMTTVYNHFALPPTLPYFCAAVAAMARDAAKLKGPSLTQFAQRELPSIEIVFDEFYEQYDKYRRDAAAWDRQYGVVAPATVMVAPAINPSASFGPTPN